MSSKVTIWAWNQAKLGDRLEPKEGPLLLTLLAIADTARNNGKVWASHGYLALKAHQSPRTIRANIEELEKRGFLRTEPTKGRPDVIWVNLTPMVLFEDGPENDEPGALEKGPRRPRQEMPMSENTSAGGAGGVGATSLGGRQEAPTNLGTEPGNITEEANACVAGQADDVREAFAFFNTIMVEIGNSPAKALNDDRRRRIKARLKDCGGLDGWRAAVERIKSSAFLTGQTHHHFSCSIDFIIQPSSFTKLTEGQYDTTSGSQADGRRGQATVIDHAAERHSARVAAVVAGAKEALDRGPRRRWRL